MEVLPPFQELLPFLAGLIAAGAVAGFLAGLFGIGGGAVLVPVFYQMLTLLHVDESVRMHVCVGHFARDHRADLAALIHEPSEAWIG